MSITIICWFLIVLAGFTLVDTLITRPEPVIRVRPVVIWTALIQLQVPVRLQYVQLYTGIAVTFISGLAILKGRNWGRFLYYVWNFLSVAFGAKTFTGMLIFGIVTFIVFSPKANTYMFQRNRAPGTKNE
jgi:hypothetical protein